MLKAKIFTLAALLVVLMSNVFVGRAVEEPFGSITKMWEIPSPWSSGSYYGEILIDTSRNLCLLSVEDSLLKVFNLNDGTQRFRLSISKGIRTYQFIENKSKLVIFSDEIYFYDCDNFNLISQMPYPESMYFLTLFSDDGSILLGAKRNDKEQPYLYIYNFNDMLLQDSIHLEEGYGPYKMTNLPGLIKISPDKSRILTITGYMDWQIFPGATVYYVFDTKTKDTILNFTSSRSSQEIISNDWKYLYVSEQKNRTYSNVDFHKINLQDGEKTKFHFDGFNVSSQSFFPLFITDNDRYIYFHPEPDTDFPIAIKTNDFTIINEFSKIYPFGNGGSTKQIKEARLFFANKGKLMCFDISNYFLTDIQETVNDTDILYPNPTNNQITIDNIITAGKTYKMTNITGIQLPILDKMQITDNSISIDMTSFVSGTYYLHIFDKISSKSYKILKL